MGVEVGLGVLRGEVVMVGVMMGMILSYVFFILQSVLD